MDSLFFYLSKWFWLLASPDHLMLLLLTLGLLYCQFRPRPRPRLRLLWVVLGLFWAVAIYPWGNLLLYPLDQRFPRPQLPAEQNLAGVVVLGGAEHIATSVQWQALQTNECAERLLVMAQLLKQYPDLPFVYTSGSASIIDQRIKGADLVRRYFKPFGYGDRIHYERASRNTYENGLLSKPMMQQLGNGKPWLLVTSAFHMPRAVGVFRGQGLNVIAYPVDYWSMPPSVHGFNFDFSQNLDGLKMGVREWLGLTAYWLTGKTSAWLPAPEQKNL